MDRFLHHLEHERNLSPETVRAYRNDLEQLCDLAKRLKRFAKSQGDQDRGMDAEDRVSRIPDRFIDFVFHETLKECFARIGTKEKETDGFLRKLFAGSSE